MSAAFSSFGNSFSLIDSLIQFAKSLQISLFAKLTIFVGITPLIFFAESNEVVTLEMSSLLTKFKSNSLIDVKTWWWWGWWWWWWLGGALGTNGLKFLLQKVYFMVILLSKLFIFYKDVNRHN